ncbi:helix-turn-helix domain-containing protein [Acrocarpospora sp. B8E8]|uniref:helix-turn-helix domain-containing protein n=1 Tax=Acrocarpospora sp. B8E8 TaxID=3153572 RepID=UPI00325F17DF
MGSTERAEIRRFVYGWVSAYEALMADLSEPVHQLLLTCTRRELQTMLQVGRYIKRRYPGRFGSSSSIDEGVADAVAILSRDLVGTTSDVAHALGISDRAVRKARVEGRISALRCQHGYLYTTAAVERFQANRNRSAHCARYGQPRRPVASMPGMPVLNQEASQVLTALSQRFNFLLSQLDIMPLDFYLQVADMCDRAGEHAFFNHEVDPLIRPLTH